MECSARSRSPNAAPGSVSFAAPPRTSGARTTSWTTPASASCALRFLRTSASSNGRGASGHNGLPNVSRSGPLQGETPRRRTSPYSPTGAAQVLPGVRIYRRVRGRTTGRFGGHLLATRSPRFRSRSRRRHRRCRAWRRSRATRGLRWKVEERVELAPQSPSVIASEERARFASGVDGAVGWLTATAKTCLAGRRQSNQVAPPLADFRRPFERQTGVHDIGVSRIN